MKSLVSSFIATLALSLVVSFGAHPQNAANAKDGADSKVLPSGAKVFISPVENGFDDYLKAAIAKKKVPLEIVDEKAKADYEITGHAESQKAGAAKIILMGSWHSREQASIQVANVQSGIVVYAYSYNNTNSAHGKRTAAESCAKHLKEKVESKR